MKEGCWNPAHSGSIISEASQRDLLANGFRLTELLWPYTRGVLAQGILGRYVTMGAGAILKVEGHGK